MKQITKEMLDKLAIHFTKYPIQLIDKDTDNSSIEAQNKWRIDGMPHQILPLKEYKEYVFCVDIGYGFDCLWDGTDWHVNKNGVFLSNIIALSDSYGYPEGAIFVNMETL